MELSSSDPAQVREWLSKNTARSQVLQVLSNYETELGLGAAGGTSSASSGGGGGAPKFRDGCSSRIGGQDRLSVTLRTLEVVKVVIGGTRWKTGATLMKLLEGLGRIFSNAAGGANNEPSIGNLVRRVMCTVRNEVLSSTSLSTNANANANTRTNTNATTATTSNATGAGSSLSDLLFSHTTATLVDKRFRSDSVGSSSSAISGVEDRRYPPSFYVERRDLKDGVMEALQETLSELEDLHNNINEQALNHIHPGQVILCYGRSKSIELFLLAAAGKKKGGNDDDNDEIDGGRRSSSFEVVVAEAAPHYSGHAMAASLCRNGISTTVVHDAAVTALAARVDVVLLSAHAVLANGGAVAPAGTVAMCLAARHAGVPVVCVTGMYKLCPVFPHCGGNNSNNNTSGDNSLMYDLLNPSDVLDRATVEQLRSEAEGKDDHTYDDDDALLEVLNPVHDYIEPELVRLYVTNIGAFRPSYIYRLLSEYYHIDDWESF